MKQKYAINIVAPPDYPHCEVFKEVAIGLQGGFADLGHKVRILYYPAQQSQDRGIFLGANILPAYPKIQLPNNAIIYNLEQTTDSSGWMQKEYLDLLRTHEVWDYSQSNISNLIHHGVHNVKWCGIGYSKLLSCIEPQDESVDVLFYGSIFGRRVPILDAVEATGLRVQKLFGAYGAERDAWIAKSKVVLNLHAYDMTQLEIVRCSYLLANKKCIISEISSEVPIGLNNGILFSHVEALPDLCKKVVNDNLLREVVANEGHRQFKRLRQSDYIKPLLTPSVDVASALPA